MGCKRIVKDGMAIGFVCTMSGYDSMEKEYWENLPDFSNKLSEYKRDFMQFFIDKGKQQKQDWIEIGKTEVDAHIENVGYDGLDWECPQNDAEDCIDYWD